jgi:hypothetical protein
MATARYEVDELSFDVPEGYVDESVNVFLASSPAMKSANILVTRESRTTAPLAQQVAAILKDVQAKMPVLKVLGHRERDVNTVPAYEARAHAVSSNKVPTYQRQLYVSWYGTLLTFIVSMPRAQTRECDTLLEQVAASLRLKKKG